MHNLVSNEYASPSPGCFTPVISLSPFYALKEFNFGKFLGGGLKCCLMEQKHVSKQMGFSQNMFQYLDLVEVMLTASKYKCFLSSHF
jgi:hypothetical protein